MKHTILDNGDIRFDLTEDFERQEIAEDLEDHGIAYMEGEIFSSYFCNWSFEWVSPEEIGALTDAPIFGEVQRDDRTDDITKVYSMWWYPNYAIRSPIDDLIRDTFTVFDKGD